MEARFGSRLMRVGLGLGLALALGGCSLMWGPGDDPRGKAYLSQVGTISLAIGRFHDEQGHYPKTLDELVPNYIAKIPDEPPLLYESTDGSMAFTYAPSWPQSGHASCAVKAGSTAFRCHGLI